MAGDLVTETLAQVTYDDIMSVRNPIDIDASADGEELSVVAQRRGDLVTPRLMRHGDALRSMEFAGDLSVINADTCEVLATWDWPEKVWNARVSPSGDRVVATASVDGVVGLWSAALDGSDRVLLLERVHRPPFCPVLGWTAEGSVVVLVDESSEAPRPVAELLAEPPEVTVDHLVNDPTRGMNAGVGGDAPSRSLVEMDIVSGRSRAIAEGLPIWFGVVAPGGEWIACVTEPSRVEMSSFATTRSVEIRSLRDGTVAASREGIVTVSYNSADPVWDPSGREVALLAEGAVVLLHTDGTAREVRAEVPFRCDRGGAEVSLEPAWTPDGSRLIVGDTSGGLWSVDRTDGSCRSIDLPAHEASVQLLTGSMNLLLTQSPERFLVVTQSPKTLERELWSLSLAGDVPVQLPAEHTTLIGPHVSGRTTVGAGGAEADRFFYVATTAGRAPEILSIDAGGTIATVSALNSAFEELALPATHRLHFDHRGETWTAFAYLPADWSSEDGPIPFVVDAYPAGDLWGRTAETVGDAYRVIPPHLLTSRGWGVLVVGGTPAREADTRADLIAPVLGGVEAAVAAGMADDRVAIVGHSAGGYLVNCAVTATSRFRAAVACNGLANLSSHFGQLYVGAGIPLMHGTANSENIAGGLPWTAPERYVEKSPLFHLDDVDTPLLLVHGTGDMFGMVQGADEMYVGLRRLGKYVEILRYHGEGHGPPHYTEPNRSHMYARVVEFLDEHLR